MAEIIVLPNVRKLFIPDPGYVLFDVDLKGADAQVVAWEAEDEDLKAAFRAGVDIHEHNAEAMLGSAFTSLQGQARRAKRKENKVAVHLTNYGGKAKTLAMSLGWTTHEADQFQKRWFMIHPKIRDVFHKRVLDSIKTTKSVSNPFGYRRIFFDRMDECFAEAVAWIPQSTVALTTFKGAWKLERVPFFLRPGFETEERIQWAVENFRPFSYIEFLLQVHDSLVFQVPTRLANDYAQIKEGLKIVVPYPDPLIIPWEIAKSDKSWGDKVKVA